MPYAAFVCRLINMKSPVLLRLVLPLMLFPPILQSAYAEAPESGEMAIFDHEDEDFLGLAVTFRPTDGFRSQQALTILEQIVFNREVAAGTRSWLTRFSDLILGGGSTKVNLQNDAWRTALWQVYGDQPVHLEIHELGLHFMDFSVKISSEITVSHAEHHNLAASLQSMHPKILHVQPMYAGEGPWGLVEFQSVSQDSALGRVYMENLDDELAEAAGETEFRPSTQDAAWAFRVTATQAAWDHLAALGRGPGEGVNVALIDTGLVSHPEIFEDGAKDRFLWAYARQFLHPDEQQLVREALEEGVALAPDALWSALPQAAQEVWDPMILNAMGASPAHGTRVASILMSPPGRQGDAHNEGSHTPVGVYGMAPDIRVLPIRASMSTVVLPNRMQAITDALEYILELNDLARRGEIYPPTGEIPPRIHLVNLSLGGFWSPALRDAVRRVQESGTLVIAAAGNGTGHFPAYPGALQGVVSASAGGLDCKPWRRSNRGKHVNIMAPGVEVWHAFPLRRALPESAGMGEGRAGENSSGERIDTVRRGMGTSFSTPYVTGAAALWISVHGYDELERRYGAAGISRVFQDLLSQPESSTTCPDLETREFGSGFLNTYKLVTQPLP